ncbi:hypothetical protein CB1_000263011 [Camelus ferus]|nr:hypothetical protein CB1_000263011 [Camelus ferus]
MNGCAVLKSQVPAFLARLWVYVKSICHVRLGISVVWACLVQGTSTPLPRKEGPLSPFAFSGFSPASSPTREALLLRERSAGDLQFASDCLNQKADLRKGRKGEFGVKSSFVEPEQPQLLPSYCPALLPTLGGPQSSQVQHSLPERMAAPENPG